jgi:hypothetical protein
METVVRYLPELQLSEGPTDKEVRMSTHRHRRSDQSPVRAHKRHARPRPGSAIAGRR